MPMLYALFYQGRLEGVAGLVLGGGRDARVQHLRSEKPASFYP